MNQLRYNQLCYNRYFKNKDTVLNRLVDNLECTGLIFSTTTEPGEQVYVCHAVTRYDDDIYYDLVLELDGDKVRLTEVNLNASIEDDNICSLLLELPVNSDNLMHAVEETVTLWISRKHLIINANALVYLPEMLGLVVKTNVENNELISEVYVDVHGVNRLMTLNITSTVGDAGMCIYDTGTGEEVMEIRFSFEHLNSYKLHNYLAGVISNTRAMLA